MISIELHYPAYPERWDYFRKTVLSMLNGRHSKTLDQKESPRSTVKTSIHIDTSVLMRVFKSNVVYDHLKAQKFPEPSSDLPLPPNRIALLYPPRPLPHNSRSLRRSRRSRSRRAGRRLRQRGRRPKINDHVNPRLSLLSFRKGTGHLFPRPMPIAKQLQSAGHPHLHH